MNPTLMMASSGGEQYGSRAGRVKRDALTEALPSVSRVAVLWNPESPHHKTLLAQVDAAAPSLRLQLTPIAVHGPDDFAGAFLAMAKAQVGAVFVADDPMFLAARSRLLELAIRGRLPTMFAHREFVPAGGLMSYGPNLSERSSIGGNLRG
jgi:ABC-type uncharacterized transport system substrate-binding protein